MIKDERGKRKTDKTLFNITIKTKCHFHSSRWNFRISCILLGYPPMFSFLLTNKLLLAILDGAIWYGIVILGAWIAMKTWERKANRGTREAKEFLKLNPTIIDSIKRELLSEQIEELVKRLKLWFIGITLAICVDLIYTYTSNFSSPLSSYPPAVIITKVFLDMGIFMGGITLAIVIGLKLIHEKEIGLW